MPSFALRYARTKHFAGFYAAETEDDLYELIDEEFDAGEFEYTVIRKGFGIELRKGEETVKYKIGSGYKAFASATSKADWVYMSDRLRDAVTRGKGLKWRKLYED